MKPISLVVCCLTLAISACQMPFSPVSSALPIASDTPVVDVAVDLAHPGRQIPADFLGLSFEAASMTYTTFEDDALVQLLQAIGPGVLRFGGNSVDKMPWSHTVGPDTTSNHPNLTPADLDRVFAFAKRIGWQVILGLNLGHYNPTAAADEAEYAVAHAGHTLLALEIGNEPDLYLGWHRQAPWDYAHFRVEFDAYVRAIRARVPNAPIAGPTTGGIKWMSQFTSDEGSQLSLVTQHSYPLWKSSSKPPDSPTYPSLDHLLSARTIHEAASTGDQVVAAAASWHLPTRIAETNSVAGGGAGGISDVFASALWGANELFTLANHGVDGVNFHGGGHVCITYSPVCLNGSGSTAQPLYYSMLLFHAASQGRLVPLSLTPNGLVTAYATVSDKGMHLALINSDQTRMVTVRFGQDTHYAHAGVQRLTAPSITARDGITFAGNAVGINGRWSPGPAEPAVADGHGFEIALPAGSAAVVTLTR